MAMADYIAGDRGSNGFTIPKRSWVLLLFKFWIRLAGFCILFSAGLVLLVTLSCLSLSAKLLTRLPALFCNTSLFGLIKEKSKSKSLPSVVITAHHTSLADIVHGGGGGGEGEAKGKAGGEGEEGGGEGEREGEEDERKEKLMIPAMGLDKADDDDADDHTSFAKDGETNCTLVDSFSHEAMKLHQGFLKREDATIADLGGHSDDPIIQNLGSTAATSSSSSSSSSSPSSSSSSSSLGCLTENEGEVKEYPALTHIPPLNSIPLSQEQQESYGNKSVKMQLRNSSLSKDEDSTINVFGSCTENDLVLTKISVYSEDSAENEHVLSRELSAYVSNENANEAVEMQEADSTEKKPNSFMNQCSGAEIRGKNNLQTTSATLDSAIERESIKLESASIQVERSSDDTIRMMLEYPPLKLEPNSSLMNSFMTEHDCNEEQSPLGIGSFRVNLVMKNDAVRSTNASVDISNHSEKNSANYVYPDSRRHSREVREGDDYKKTNISYSFAPPYPMFTHEAGESEDLLQKSSINMELKTIRSNSSSERTSLQSMQKLGQDSVSKGETDYIATESVDNYPSGGGQSIQESGRELKMDEDYESIESVQKYGNTIWNNDIDTSDKPKRDDESFCLTDPSGRGKAIQGVREWSEANYENIETTHKYINTFCNDDRNSSKKCKHGDDGDESFGHLDDVETLSNNTVNNVNQDLEFYSTELGSFCSNKVEYSVENRESVSSSSSRVSVRGHKLHKYLRIHQLRRKRGNLHYQHRRNSCFLSLQNSVDELPKPGEDLRSTSLIKGCSFLKFLPKTQRLPETVCITESGSSDQDETYSSMEQVITNEIETVKTILGCQDVESSMPFIQQVEALYKFAGMENLIRYPCMENHNDRLHTVKKKLELLTLVIGVK